MENHLAILITGASSGLGAALALDYAAPGVVLFLSGRDQARLDAVSQKARAKGAEVYTRILDVSSQLSMEAWVEACQGQNPLDLVIANAGISGGTHKGQTLTDKQAREVFQTNVEGVLNTISAAIPKMKERGRGQIAIMASLAGFRGMPGAAAYSASKAAVRVYGEALRGELAPYGVKVSVICPGFVETPMTEINTCFMPFLMKADRAAQIIRRGLDQNKARIAFPWPMAALVWLFAAAPTALVDRLLIGYREDSSSPKPIHLPRASS